MGGLITLTTDFGTRDAYVAALKGVLLTIAPGALLVDITHEIPQYDLVAAALVVAGAAPYFPNGAVHLVVVDPGVGSERRLLAARTKRAYYVAPDNGVLCLALRQEPALELVSLTERRYWRSEISPTFHGRDIMGSVAAHLANGIPLAELGPPVTDPAELALPAMIETGDGGLIGEILYVDRFGNLISNIPAGRLPPRARVSLGEMAGEPLRRSYAEVQRGQALALVGSHGYLEIAVREGSASQVLRAGRGARVTVTPEHWV